MQLNFELTSDDFRQAFQAYFFRSTLIRILVCCAVLGLSVVIFAFVTNSTGLFQNLKPLGILSVVWMATMLSLPYISSKRAVKMPAMVGPRTLEISPDGFHVKSAVVDSKVAWSLFSGWIELPKQFLLFQPGKVVVPVPKRGMSDAQQGELRALLGQYVKRK